MSARKCGQSTRELIEGMIEISPFKSTIKTRFRCTPMDLVNELHMGIVAKSSPKMADT